MSLESCLLSARSCSYSLLPITTAEKYRWEGTRRGHINQKHAVYLQRRGSDFPHAVCHVRRESPNAPSGLPSQSPPIYHRGSLSWDHLSNSRAIWMKEAPRAHRRRNSVSRIFLERDPKLSPQRVLSGQNGTLKYCILNQIVPRWCHKRISNSIEKQVC